MTLLLEIIRNSGVSKIMNYNSVTAVTNSGKLNSVLFYAGLRVKILVALIAFYVGYR